MNEQSRESLKEDRNVGSATGSDFCRAVARAVCSPLTIVEPGSHPPNISISFRPRQLTKVSLALLSAIRLAVSSCLLVTVQRPVLQHYVCRPECVQVV